MENEDEIEDEEEGEVALKLDEEAHLNEKKDRLLNSVHTGFLIHRKRCLHL